MKNMSFYEIGSSLLERAKSDPYVAELFQKTAKAAGIANRRLEKVYLYRSNGIVKSDAEESLDKGLAHFVYCACSLNQEMRFFPRFYDFKSGREEKAEAVFDFLEIVQEVEKTAEFIALISA